jgi:hypothetical protein
VCVDWCFSAYFQIQRLDHRQVRHTKIQIRYKQSFWQVFDVCYLTIFRWSVLLNWLCPTLRCCLWAWSCGARVRPRGYWRTGGRGRHLFKEKGLKKKSRMFQVLKVLFNDKIFRICLYDLGNVVKTTCH